MAIPWSTKIFKKIGQLVSLNNTETFENNESIKNEVNSLFISYITLGFPLEEDVDGTFQGFDDLFQFLKDLMIDNSQTINGNTVAAGAITFTGAGTGKIQDNTSPTPVADQVTPTQMILDTDVIRIVNIGAGVWTLNSLLRGKLGKQAQDNILYGDDNVVNGVDTAGIAFTIVDPVAEVLNDGGGLLNTDQDLIAGGSKNVNSDADGKVYLEITGAGPSSIIAWDSAANRTAGGSTGKVFSTASYASPGNIEIVEENSSGITGIIVVDSLGADLTVEIILKIAYANGDEFEVGACTSSDDALFETFMRDVIKLVLPADLAGGETIADALAS